MDHAGLMDVWNILRAIVARQMPFAQIMIAAGAVFFIVMAIEGVRTSIVAIRTSPAEPKAQTKTYTSAVAEPAEDGPVTRLYAGISSTRQAARPVRNFRRIALPVVTAKRLTPAIRRHPKLDLAEYSAESTSR